MVGQAHRPRRGTVPTAKIDIVGKTLRFEKGRGGDSFTPRVTPVFCTPNVPRAACPRPRYALPVSAYLRTQRHPLPQPQAPHVLAAPPLLYQEAPPIKKALTFVPRET